MSGSGHAAWADAVRAALGTEAVTRTTRVLLDRAPPGGAARWTRRNHRGEDVSMLEGPAVAAGLVAGAAIGAPGVRAGVASIIATGTAAAFGLVDDLTEDTSTRTKGLRGHLGALAHGRVTTGGLKVIGIGAGALVAAAVATPAPRGTGGSRVTWLADVAASGALIAVSANLVNLLDLRPGRALKASAVAAAGLLLVPSGAALGASVLAAADAARDGDLAERDMLGDGGANALGAALGLAYAVATPRPWRLALLLGGVALTIASEKVSFTEVIARTPVLRELDALGRRTEVPRG